MLTPISVVDLVTGIVEDATPETPTLDVPLDLDGGAGDVALDATGLVHYAGSGGTERTGGAKVRWLSERRPGETCLVIGPEADRDPDGRRRFHLSVLEA